MTEVNHDSTMPAPGRRVGQPFLQSSGLLWKINHDLLHPYGLSLGVFALSPGDGGPVILTLHPADDGVWEFHPDIDWERARRWAYSTETFPTLRDAILATQRPERQEPPETVRMRAMFDSENFRWLFDDEAVPDGAQSAADEGEIIFEVPAAMFTRWRLLMDAVSLVRFGLLEQLGLDEDEPRLKSPCADMSDGSWADVCSRCGHDQEAHRG